MGHPAGRPRAVFSEFLQGRDIPSFSASADERIGRPAKTQAKVKCVGQECPTHTSDADPSFLVDNRLLSSIALTAWVYRL